jgi:hypothetical protein
MDDARLEAKFRELTGEEGAQLLKKVAVLDPLQPFSPP